MPDSIAELIIIPPYNAADTLIDTDLEHALEAGAAVTATDLKALRKEIPVPPPTWEDGLEGTPRPLSVGDSNGVLAIVTGMFVVMLLSFKYCRRLFSTLFKELLGVRRRANAFDEHTSNESQMMVLMAVQWSVYTGLLLYSLMNLFHKVDPADAFADTVKLIALTGSYYLVQLFAYMTVGYAFTTPMGCRYYVKGFSASQSLLGFALIVPALVAIFYETAAETMLLIAGVLYILARIIFIIKGFRIFYQNFSSLLYFILYLCTLEIIPLLIIYKIALLLVNSQ